MPLSKIAGIGMYVPEKVFTNNDSVIIYGICEACEKKIVRYGYPVQEEKSVVFFG